MASIISASTTSATALNLSGDTTGILQLATGATPTTAVTIDASQKVTFANSLTSPTFVTPILGTPTSGVLDNCTGTNLAKAWANFDQNGSISIKKSFNISSITYVGVGSFTVNFTNALSDANYIVTGSGNAYNSSYGSGGIVLCVGAASPTSAPTLKSTTQCNLNLGGTSTGVAGVNISIVFFD